MKAAEHAAGVSLFVEELELEGEDEVSEFFFGAEESVALDVLAEAANGVVLALRTRAVASGGAPAGEVFAVEEGFEAIFLEGGGVDFCWKSGWQGEGSEFALFFAFLHLIPRDLTPRFFCGHDWRFLRLSQGRRREEEREKKWFHFFGRKKAFCLSEMVKAELFHHYEHVFPDFTLF